MVSKKLIKGYDLNSLEDYFQYILNSRINGNGDQCIDLFEKLSEKQRIDFYVYVYDVSSEGALVDFLKFLKGY